jgi:hypothetical protein
MVPPSGWGFCLAQFTTYPAALAFGLRFRRSGRATRHYIISFKPISLQKKSREGCPQSGGPQTQD